jgi:hypothetical protein
MDRGLSCFNAPHNLVINFIYALPSANGHGRVLSALTSGWGISGILTAHSGFPFNTYETVERGRTGVLGGTSPTPTDRPNWNPGRNPYNATHGVSSGCAGVPAGTPLGTPNLFYDPCAFTLQPAGTLGDVARDSLLGPRFAQLDFGVRKDTKLRFLGEAGNLQIRAEFFNIFNHPNLGMPNPGVLAGTLTDVAEAPLSNAGQIVNTASTSRQAQLSLRLVF